MLKYILIFFVCCSAVSMCACNGGGSSGTTTVKTEHSDKVRKANISITSPMNNDRQALGSEVVLSVKVKDPAEPLDSLRWLIDGKWFTTTKTDEAVTWNTSGKTTGKHRIEAIAHYASGQRDIVSVSILLLAAQAPKEYGYKIIKTYPHDTKAYTQGLLFDDGYLYESTGQKGESSLRKVVLATGEPVQVTNIPPEMFGEGLVVVDDKLIQLTWQDQVAFIYNKADFKLLNRISYPMKEGWGLSYDGTHVLMTDGTATLYFLDKDYLSEAYRIEVCDHKGPVMELNELEYINGELWANVYRTDDILRINPATGEVTGRINMKGLLKQGDLHPAIDVLNGIAYDGKTGKIYVTGKNWPKLYEIQVTEKK